MTLEQKKTYASSSSLSAVSLAVSCRSRPNILVERSPERPSVIFWTRTSVALVYSFRSLVRTLVAARETGTMTTGRHGREQCGERRADEKQTDLRGPWRRRMTIRGADTERAQI